jgi:hypothetical protein
MSCLQEENCRLKEELRQVKDELEHKNNKILSLEAQVSAMLIAGGKTKGTIDRGPICRKPSLGITVAWIRRFSDELEALPSSNKPRSASVMPEQASNKSSPEAGASNSMRPRSRGSISDSTSDSIQAPIRISKESETQMTSDGQAMSRTATADRMATPLPRPSADAPTIKDDMNALEEAILKEAARDEQSQGDCLERDSKAPPRDGIGKNCDAIKALPRELSIFNSEDDDITCYSEDEGTYEVRNMDMRDAFNYRGVYTGTVSSRRSLMQHGRGIMRYQFGGRSYEGDWCRGHWHGQGIMRNAHGDVYKGQLVNDLKEGPGALTYADGRVLTGRFKDDYCDNGQLLFPDGSRYAGELQDGKRHGFGVYHFADGGFYQGYSEHNTFHGQGKMRWCDDGIYEGEWQNGEIHGYGAEIRTDGTLRHRGIWENGAPIRR